MLDAGDIGNQLLHGLFSVKVSVQNVGEFFVFISWLSRVFFSKDIPLYLQALHGTVNG